nr:integrase, catalytic region, zinc finger, CCHC-type, peptidase aspartic, catalytic [Tanacetum cinerariifolium]
MSGLLRTYPTEAIGPLSKGLQARLRDLKGKSSDTLSASNTLDLLNQKLESKIVELEFQVLRAWVFENTSEFMNNTSGTSVTPHVDKPKLSEVTPHSKKLHASIPSHSEPQLRKFNVMKHRNVITAGMFKINPFQTSRVDLVPNKQSSASIRTNSITNSQRHVIVKENVSSNTITAYFTGNVITAGMFKINPSQTSRVDLVPNKQSSASIRTNSITNSQRHVIVKENVSSNTITASFTGLVHTARTRRPRPKCNTRNAMVPSASKSSEVKKNVTVEDHRRTLLLSKNQKTMSSECNNIKLVIQNDKSEIVVQICLWCIDSGCSKHMTGNIKLLINSVWKFLGTVRFENDHIAAILGYGDLKWGNITITKVYFVEGLGHNLFLIGQFCDADLEPAFRRNTCFIRDLD